MTPTNSDPKTASTTAGCAKYVGHIGALAVALGVGAAIANSPGIALADTSGSGSSAGSSTASSSARSDSSSTSSTTSAGRSHTGSFTPPHTVAARPDSGLSIPSEIAKSAADSASEAKRHQPAVAAQAVSGVASTVSTARSEARRLASQPVTEVTTVTDSAAGQLSEFGMELSNASSAHSVSAAVASPTAQTAVMNAAAALSTNVAAAQEIPAAAPSRPVTPVDAVSRLVSGLLSLEGLNPQATNNPVVPPQSMALLAMLGWVRRETQSAFRANSPTIANNPASNGQTIDGAANGGLNATQALMDTASSSTTASPLGTADQLAAEKRATQIVNTPVVRLATIALKVGWFLEAENNFALVGGPDQANLAQLNDAASEYATQAAMEVQLLDPNNPEVLQGVMPPHTWYGQTVPGSRILYDNPDTIYRFIPVNSASSYVITGQFEPGAVPADTNFSVLTGLGGTTAENLNGQDLQVNPDGTFTITVDSSPTAPGQTNHIQLPPGATLITARDTLSDWNSQEPMSLSITRISGPPDSLFAQIGGYDIPKIGPLVASNPQLVSLVSVIPPFSSPPLVLQSAETAVLMVAFGLTMENQYMQVATTDPTTGQLQQPNVLSQPAHNAQFLSTQLQSTGYFELTDQQALVITVNPGDAGYFSVPVTNDWTITNNYWDQQTSLNNSQAVANPDGTYTFVVSKTDPGVANWVSTGGLNQGTISIRFQDFNPNSTTAPTVTTQVVPIDELSTVLPPTTEYVTPEERQAQIAARQAGYNNRYAPYPQV